MKKVLFLTSMVLILSSATTKSFPVKKSSVRSKLRKEISAQVGFPSTLTLAHTESVPVRFKTDAHMNLHIIEVQSEHEGLRTFIQRAFSKIKINKAHLFPETEYRIAVNIKDLR